MMRPTWGEVGQSAVLFFMLSAIVVLVCVCVFILAVDNPPVERPSLTTTTRPLPTLPDNHQRSLL